MNIQEELRQRCKLYKWQRGIQFYIMAKSIGMNKNAFYNFISNKNVRLGYTYRQKLNNYLNEVERNG